jgi:hypothetical protein
MIEASSVSPLEDVPMDAINCIARNPIFKYDKDTQRILIVSAKERTIVTFYKASDGLNSFKQAMRDHWDAIK